jgi:hypothetical protein
MQSHEHAMQDSITSHERNLSLLIDARSVGIGADYELDSDELDSLGVDVDNMFESADDAISNYALEVSVERILTVTLAIGGPTQYLSAPIAQVEGRSGAWERTGPITYHDSWAVPNETTVPETTVSDVTNLAAFFDSYVETYSE